MKEGKTVGISSREEKAPEAEATRAHAVAAPAASGRQAQVCPTFVLRADKPGHLRALMGAMPALPAEDQRTATKMLREFEFWEEAHRK